MLFDAGDRASIRLTSSVPGTGGHLRERPEDFIVEELPLYEPSGEGEHLYLFVEKRNFSTMQMIHVLARHFGVPKRAVGVAGLKDRCAVTRQLVSVHMPGRSERDVPVFEHDSIRILWTDRHVNKLRRGHLAGNRFVIRIRGVDAFSARHASKTLSMLAGSGVPNRLGEQRFGYARNNHLIGRAMLLGAWREACDLLLGPTDGSVASQARAREAYSEGDLLGALAVMPRSAVVERHALRTLVDSGDHRRAVMHLETRQREFYVTAFQSAVFNAVLDRRLAEGTFDRLLVGDLAMLTERRAVFAVDEDVLADAETARRMGSLEIGPSGPMWGRQMSRAGGVVDALEVEALVATGVEPGLFDRREENPLRDVPGERRPMRVPVTMWEVEGGADEFGSYVRCAFDLPRGSFATVVMDEVMKSAGAAGAADDEGDGDGDEVGGGFGRVGSIRSGVAEIGRGVESGFGGESGGDSGGDGGGGGGMFEPPDAGLRLT